MSENVEVVKLDTQPAQASIKELRNLMKALKDEMAGLEEGSEAFLEAATKAGTLKHQIDEINDTVKGASADFGDMLGNVTKVTTGVIGGIQAAKGALTLFGIESEEVTKAIQKMQASMAIIQGMNSIDLGIKALAKLRAAITGTTAAAKLLRAALTPKSILLLTAAITAIVAVWNKFGDSIEQALPFITKIKNAFNETEDAAKKAKEALEEYLNNVKSAKEVYEEIKLQNKVNKLNSDAKKQYDDLNASLKEYNAHLKYITEQQSKPGISRLHWQELQNEASAISNVILDLEHQKTALINNSKSYETNTKVIKDNTDATKEAKAVKDTFFDDAYAEIEYNKAINSEYANSKVALEDLLYIQLQELDTLTEGTAAWYKLATTIEETKQSIADFGKTDEESVTTETTQPTEIEKNPLIVSLYDTKDALADLASDNSWGIILNNIGNLGIKMAEVGKLIKQNGKQDWTAYALIAAAALNSIGTIMNQLAALEEGNDDESFERKKKLEISGAVMNMLGGIVGAVSSAMNPANAWMTAPGQIAMAATMSALIAGVGAAQIANIAKQSFSASPTPTPTVSESAINTTIIPPVEYSSAVQGAETELSITNSQSYVTVEEINRVGNRVNVAENESRY